MNDVLLSVSDVQITVDQVMIPQSNIGFPLDFVFVSIGSVIDTDDSICEPSSNVIFPKDSVILVKGEVSLAFRVVTIPN